MKSYREQTYYELLEVPPSASMDEIRAAYERAAKLYDPENVALYPVGDAGEVEELKRLLLEAMEILTDADLRGEYDRSLGLGGGGEPAEIDARAAEARKQGEAEVEHAVAEHLHLVPAPKPAPEATGAPIEAPQPSPPEVTEGEGDAPRQLVMQEVISRAETVHSTAPRYAISYIPHPPRVEELPSAESEAPASPAGAARAASAGGEAPAAAPSAAREAPAAAPSPAEEMSAAAPSVPAPPAHGVAPAIASAAFASSAPEAASGVAPPASTPPALGEPEPPEEVRTPAEAPHAAGVSGASTRLDDAQLLAQESAINAAETAMAQVSAHVQRNREVREAREPQRPRAVEIPADAELNGELLRQIRKGRGLTVQQLAERTRISTRHLENVEADRYDALPTTVYLRGILMNLARELAVDPVRVSKGYLALVEKALGKLK